MPTNDTPIKDDLCRGTEEIAEYTGDKIYTTYRMCERGELPVFKLNRRWCMRKSAYVRLIERLEAGEAT